MGDNSLLGYLNETFDEYYKKKDIIKRVAGVINYVVPDTNYAVANVQIGDKSLNLLNKTGEILSEGDHVWVYYWHTLTDGYIALRNGEALNIGGLENAAVITEQQDTVYNISKVVRTVDTANKVKTYYGNTNNAIILNKYTALAMDVDTYPSGASYIGYGTETDGYAELNNRVTSMSERLWSNKVKSYWIPNEYQFTAGNEYTYFLKIAHVRYSGTQWSYQLGVFCEEVPAWYEPCPGYTTSPSALTNTGLIFIYDSIDAPNSTLTSFQNLPTAHAALAICYSANALMYWTTNERIIGLARGLTRTATPFRNMDEYNYAIALTSEREIISSGG